MKWNFEDALILKSIQISTIENKSKCDFKMIFETFDWLNHSVLKLENLKSSLEKLISVNFVEIENDNLILTKKFVKEYSKLTENVEMTNSTDLNRIHSFLKRTDFEIQELCQIDNRIQTKIKNARFEYLKQ